MVTIAVTVALFAAVIAVKPIIIVNSEHYVNTGSIDEFGKERVSKVTGKTVTNYVDNDTFCNAVVDWKLKCEIAEAEGQKKPTMPE